MKTPHKHAELIKAWADGAEIQLKTNADQWVDCVDSYWNVDATYRIKPEPDFVLFGLIEHHLFDDRKASKATLRNTNESLNRVDNIKITFDGTTGKLKSVEVIG